MKDNPHFCMMPWIGLYVEPNGNSYPCCMASKEFITPINIYELGSIEKVRNSPLFTQLKENMLNGVSSPLCERCDILDKAHLYTMRQNSNYCYGKDFSEEKLYQLKYLDIRWSHRCNLKCRTCGPEYSSSWQKDAQELNIHVEPFPKNLFEKRQALLKDLLGHMDTMEEIHFAGGEPLYQEEHYTLLQEFIERKMFNLKIRYTTNFSISSLQERKVFDYWNQFHDIRIAASLDDDFDRASYLRSGSDWQQIVTNRKLMLQYCPNVYFEITPTISAYNLFSFPKFYKSWIDQKLLDPPNLRINILTSPHFMDVHVFDRNKLDKAIVLYQDLLDCYKDYPTFLSSQAANGINALISYLKEDKKNDVKSLHHFNKKLDHIRKEKSHDIYSHLQ